MQAIILQKRPMLIIGIAGFALSSVLIFLVAAGLTSRSYSYGKFASSGKPWQTQPARKAANIARPKFANSTLPIRLKIPKIKVDAAVEPVGLTPDGAVDVPRVPADAAWYDLGPEPGDIGSAVINGHYGPWINGEKSVFDNLNKLNKGDSISVQDATGAVTNFVVREFRTLSPNEAAPEVFISSDGKAHLNLITCSGVWNQSQKSYSNRLVIFADKQYE